MTTYYQALKAIEYLLDKAGEKHWRDWIREDIRHWETGQDVTHHLSAYGGMGSFNDVVLCRENRHRVTQAQAPWVQHLFDILKGICYRLAHTPHADKSLSRLVSSGTRYLPVVEAFAHHPQDTGTRVGLSRQLEKITSQLHGWRCLECGYAETRRRDLEQFIARQTLPSYLRRIRRASGLRALVNAAFAVDFPRLEATRARLAQAVRKSGLNIRERRGWMRPCPRCGSANTAVYRWQAAASDPLSFRPARDNLPMK